MNSEAGTLIQTNIDWTRVRATYGKQLTEIEGLLQQLEQENHFQLSVGALEILLIPIVELLEKKQPLNTAEAHQSLRRLFITLRDDPIQAEKGIATRSALSIFKSLTTNSCKVPPWCGK